MEVHHNNTNTTSILIFIRKLIFCSYIPYFTLYLIIYLVNIIERPSEFSELTSRFFDAITSLYGIYIVPIIIIALIVKYLYNKTDVRRIPKNSSLYESIVYPVIQYGPIKIINTSVNEQETEEGLIGHPDYLTEM